MKIYAFIFARGGSKGVPGKNIRKLVGKPLLAYSIELAKEIQGIEKIFVSTENNQIAVIAEEWGASVIPRPAELAQDDTPEWQAWKHAVQWLEERGEYFDVFLSLPTTSPLRNKEDVTKCLKYLNEKTDVVVGMTEAARNPWFNMVQEEGNGYLKILMESDRSYERRQDTPKIYGLTTVAYVTRPGFIKVATGVFEGRVRGVEIPAERALDIDTELDFKIAELLMSQKNTRIVQNDAE